MNKQGNSLTKEQWDNLINAVDALYDPKYNTTTVDGYDFVCTCHACPEQYDVYKGKYTNGNKVAYVRKRWGHLTVDLLDANHTCIYHETGIDEWDGMIDNRDETFKKIVKILNNLPY